MLNLVAKFTPDTVEASNDEGVVAIEYVLVTALVAIGVGIVFDATGIWAKLSTKLNAIIP